MAFDFKAATPDTTITTDAYLMGADSQSAANPSLYQLKDVLGYIRLTANTTFYVRTDGSDTNTGTANTAGGAWETIQYALDRMAYVDANGYGVTIQIADGGYAQAVNDVVCMYIVCRPKNALYYYVVGNETTPANVYIDGVNQNPYGILVGSKGSGDDIPGIFVDKVSGITIKNAYYFAFVTAYSNCNIYKCLSEDNYYGIFVGSASTVNANYLKFKGNHSYLGNSAISGYLGFANFSFDTGATYDTTAFVVDIQSYTQIFFPSYTNLSATGGAIKYDVLDQGLLQTNGASSSIPGSAGSVASTGVVL